MKLNLVAKICMFGNLRSYHNISFGEKKKKIKNQELQICNSCKYPCIHTIMHSFIHVQPQKTLYLPAKFQPPIGQKLWQPKGGEVFVNPPTKFTNSRFTKSAFVHEFRFILMVLHCAYKIEENICSPTFGTLLALSLITTVAFMSRIVPSHV